MKIAIDARWIFEQISGIGAYTRELVRALPSLGADNEYLLYFSSVQLRDRTMDETGLHGCSSVKTAVLPWGVFSPVGQFLMGRRLASDGVEVFHSTNYMIPVPAFSRRRDRGPVCIVTVHDVIPMVMRDQVGRSLKNRLFPVYRRIMVEVGARADAIVTDSAASREDVVRQLCMAPGRADRVHVVHCGVAPAFLRGAGGVAGNCGATPERTVLYVGRADPYKNLVGLVEAFARLLKSVAGPLVLRIVGPADPRYPEAAGRARALGIGAAVRWTGYVGEEELVRLYRSASMLVLPSRYEGFGLPVVEAMASGTPVVCSDIPVLREVGGDAAAFVNPDDTAGMADAMKRILQDRQHADALRARGLERAGMFTWEETARKTLGVYEAAVARRAGR